jgi:hypothetical protein
VESTLERVDCNEFTEDTGLEGPDIELAISQAARAILTWPDLGAHMPMLFRDVVLTVGATSEGLVLAEGFPMVLVAASVDSQADEPEHASSLFSRCEKGEGVAVLMADSEMTVAVVRGNEEGELTPTEYEGTAVLAYEAGDDVAPVVLFLAAERDGASAAVCSEGADPAGPFQLEGNVVWDPEAVEVQAIGPGVLFKRKIGEHGFRLGSAEGLARRIAVAKDSAPDAENTMLLINK